MINYVGVLPYAYKPYFDECRKTIRPPLSEYIYNIDNTKDNVGVAESWNRGIYYMRKFNADWLIIISATMRFGEAGGLDMLRQIEKHQYAHIIHFAKKDVPEQNFGGTTAPPSYDEGVFYWHLTAVRADVFDQVGYFDPNFYPIYFEDTDFDLRCKQVFGANDERRLILPVDAASAGLRHGVEKAGIKPETEKLIAYFATKWGRHPSAAELGEYSRPFNDYSKSVAFFPPARGRLWDE